MAEAAASILAPSRQGPLVPAPIALARILVAVDASDHANRAVAEAARLAASAGGTLTGIHAYAAKLHDRRFRQMEGGLPARYREEGELERQREVHDSLIARGLGIIGDSYHDAAENVCAATGVPYLRLSPEGKNYRRIAEAAASGQFDLIVLGAVGLGIVPESVVGTVCERVARRSPIDILVIRDHRRPLGDGPIVVGIDGSPRSFGALRTAIDVGRRLGAPVHAVAAYDPYFHYVAFRRIAGGLNDEAGQVFRFKEQEKLHEEIIDDGLAKIYASHLEVARTVASEAGVGITTQLLDGKPFQTIARYLTKVRASLLFVGRTGIHADPDLDIGGNAENLLRLAPCHIWIGAATHTPPLDAVARETIVWSAEAELKVGRIPESVRGMARMAILRYAHAQGHTVITSALVDQATARLCPGHGRPAAAGAGDLPWSSAATALVESLGDAASATAVRLRAEKRARRDGAAAVAPDHVRPFLVAEPGASLRWSAAALARVSRLPQTVRDDVRGRAEGRARNAGEAAVTVASVERAIADAGDAAPEADSRDSRGHRASRGG